MRRAIFGMVLVLMALLLLATVAQADGIDGAIGARLEVGAVAAVSPTVTGTGAAVSYRLTALEQERALWVTGGVLRWNEKTDGFVGVDTNVPIGGKTVTENTAIGGGWLIRAQQPFLYTRARWSF